MALPAPVVMFDDGAASLGALADLRPVFTVRTGAMTLLERVGVTWGESAVAAWWVPAHLRAVAAESTRTPVNDSASIPAEAILLNGRCVLSPDWLDRIAPNEAVIDAASGHLVGARVSGDHARAFLETGRFPESVRTARDPDVVGGTPTTSTPMLFDPWDVIRHRDVALAWDLHHLVHHRGWGPPGGVMRIGAHPVCAAPTVSFFPSVVLDASAGPIVIDEDATLRSNAVVCGPAYIGSRSTVLDGAVVRPNCAIGPVCKVNGEVSGSIFQSHANKAHDGFLGDSWVGEWANLGAGTITSNLLNTYGEIVAQVAPNAKRQKTGLTFFGSIIGDHVKTAIGTRLMTGSVIGTGAMIAVSAHAPTAIGRFEWITDEGRRMYRIDKFIDVMHAVMHRRSVTPGNAYVSRIRDLVVDAERGS